MTRRNMLGAAGAAAFLSAGSASPQPAPAQALPGFGGAPAGFPVHSRAARGGGKPFDMVTHCHDLGLGVVETRLSSTDPEAVKALRRRVESYGMRLILDVGYPRDEAGLPAFDAGVKAAKKAGAISLRAAMTGRRYEDMNSLEAFRKDFERCQRSIALAEPVLRKYRLPL